MTRTPQYPVVDGRRVSELRRVLLRDIKALAPDWRAVEEADGPDRALVEIAARLAEEATKRLDRTAERDALAFLELFDIPPPRPSAALGVSVFALKEDRTSPVTASARNGVEIETTEGETATFETLDDLRIHPARIERLATVDPGADKLEIAPPDVTTFEPDLTPRPDYALAASVGPEGTVISINPPVGILPGDLLRVSLIDGEVVFLDVAEVSGDGLLTLKEQVGGAGLTVDAVSAIERMTRLDAFAMPDVQEHGLYIGDADILNVKEPAEITLRFSPPSVASALSSNTVAFEVFGTREGPGRPEETPRWHRLVRLAGGGADLRLYKAWMGPLEPLKLGEKESLWIRIQPHDPITPETEDHPLTAPRTALDRVTLGIATEKPEDEGGDTVSQVAHNGAPLPLAPSFLPFGAEPRRFDVFALAAPEAFTKPDATAVLEFDLMDATTRKVSSASRLDGERHAYGVGLNGRLQVIDLTGGQVLWREVGGPPIEEGSETKLSLDPETSVAACSYSGSGRSDMVIARTVDGRVAWAVITIGDEPEAGARTTVSDPVWTLLPNLPDGLLQQDERPTLVVAPLSQSGPISRNNDEVLVLAAGSGGVYRLAIDAQRLRIASNWVPVTADADAPKLPTGPALIAADESIDDDGGESKGAFLTVDEKGVVWVLLIALDMLISAALPVWRQLRIGDAPIKLAKGARPAALWWKRDGERLLLAGLPDDQANLNLWDLDLNTDGSRTEGLDGSDPIDSGFEIDASATLRVIPGLSTGGEIPAHVVGYQNSPFPGLAFEWAPSKGQVAQYVPRPDMALSDPLAQSAAAIFPPDDKDDHALLAFGVDDQTLVRLRLSPSVPVQARLDTIVVPQATTDTDGSNLIMLERARPGDAERSIVTTEVFAENDAGDDVIALLPEETDWDEPVRVFRTKSEVQDVTFAQEEELGGHLVGDADGIEAGQLLLVRRKDDVSRYGIFTVDRIKRDGADDRVFFVESDALGELMGDQTEATWLEIDEVAGTDAETRASAEGTLVRIEPSATSFNPKILGLFESPGIVTNAEVLRAFPQVLDVIVDGWSGAPPEIGQLIKVPDTGSASGVFEVTILTSNVSSPELSWEYFNGNGWKRLEQDFRDTTNDFTRSGVVSFTVPRNLEPTDIGGQLDRWIRARLVDGDYGKPVYKVVTEPGESSNGDDTTIQKVVVDTDDLRPPEVKSVTARFALTPEHPPEFIVARNNLRDLDQSSANRLAGASFAMFEGAFAEPLGAGSARAILLGLTRPLEPGSASLLVTANDQPKDAVLLLETLGPDNRWTPAPLSGEDPTRGLHRSGLIRFNVAERPAQAFLLGRTLHWLRLRVEETPDWSPTITGLWLNGVAIVQAETVRRELLASSAGEPRLELTLSKPPVLADSLELRVRERLSDEEREALNDSKRDGEPEPVLTDPPNLRGDWVLWKQVDSLQDAAADARVYLMNPDGRLRFGDDRYGRIVPAGRDNIRAFSYQSGGQRVETSTFAAAALSGSVEGVELVLAPSPIAGGTRPPEPPELVARMPDVLRHAGHGLSLADLEALARDADSEIVQVRAFPPAVAGGPVRLIVLARGESRTPAYSLAKRENLRRVLSAAMSDAWPSACLEVRSAAFAEVEVGVNLVAKRGQRATLESEAGLRLRTFLHAAEGGPENSGWPPGRALWPTDIRRALADLDGLDSIAKVAIDPKDDRALGDVQDHEVIAAPEASDVTVLVDGEAET